MSDADKDANRIALSDGYSRKLVEVRGATLGLYARDGVSYQVALLGGLLAPLAMMSGAAFVLLGARRPRS